MTTYNVYEAGDLVWARKTVHSVIPKGEYRAKIIAKSNQQLDSRGEDLMYTVEVEGYKADNKTGYFGFLASELRPRHPDDGKEKTDE